MTSLNKYVHTITYFISGERYDYPIKKIITHIEPCAGNGINKWRCGRRYGQETQIWTTYALSPYLRANDIKVSVHGGKATLTGKVEESVNKDLAKQIAMGVNGIKDVDNQIVIEANYVPPAHSTRSFGEVVDDATERSSEDP